MLVDVNVGNAPPESSERMKELQRFLRKTSQLLSRRFQGLATCAPFDSTTPFSGNREWWRAPTCSRYGPCLVTRQLPFVAVEPAAGQFFRRIDGQ